MQNIAIKDKSILYPAAPWFRNLFAGKSADFPGEDRALLVDGARRSAADAVHSAAGGGEILIADAMT